MGRPCSGDISLTPALYLRIGGGKWGLFPRSALLDALLLVYCSSTCPSFAAVIIHLSPRFLLNLGEFGFFGVQLKTWSFIQAFWPLLQNSVTPPISLSVLHYHFVLLLTRDSSPTSEAAAVPVPLFNWCYLVITRT